MVTSQKSNTQTAIEELRRMIFSGELSPGSNYFEMELAELLNMSRTPVREATLTLAGQGLLQVQPRRGVRITPIDVREMTEIYEVVMILECLATERAAKAGHKKRTLKKLFANIDETHDALADENIEHWAHLDEAFHLEVGQLSQSAHLVEVIESYLDRVRRVRNLTMHLIPLPMSSVEAHEIIAKAILDGDADTASHVHRQHRVVYQDKILEVLGKLGYTSR